MKDLSAMKTSSPAAVVPALQRGLALLQELATRPQGAAQAELASRLGLSQTTVHRLALALEELGYLQKLPGSRLWRVTQKLLLLGQPHSGTRSLVEACLPSMRRILDWTNETTQVCVLAETSCVILEQLPSRHPFKYVVDPGSRAPVQCCAPGKAMLAFMPEGQAEALVGALSFEPFTRHSVRSPEALLIELEEVRRRGYAVDRAEHFEGIHCVAAPLLDLHGMAFGAITIAGPSSRVSESRFSEWGEFIREAASEAALQFML